MGAPLLPEPSAQLGARSWRGPGRGGRSSALVVGSFRLEWALRLPRLQGKAWH